MKLNYKLGLIKKITSIPWVKEKERDGKVAIDSFYLVGHQSQYFHRMGIKFQVRYNYFQSGTYYFSSEEIKAAQNYLSAKGTSLGIFSQHITDKFLKSVGKYQLFIQKYSNYNFEKLSNKQLAKVFSAFTEHTANLIPYSFMVSMILEKVANEQIVGYLSEGHPNPSNIYSQLITSKKSSKSSNEYFSKISLALLFSKNGATDFFSKEAARHLKKYGYLSIYQPGVTAKTLEQLIDEIKEIAAHNMAKSQLLKAKKDPTLHSLKVFELEKLQLPKHLRKLVLVMQKNVWVRTYRREIMSSGFYSFIPMYTTIAKRMDIHDRQIQNVACWEIQQFLEHGTLVNKNTLSARSQSFAGVRLGGKPFILDSHLAKKVVIKEAKQKKQNLPGISVYPGLVTSKVSIVRTKNDMAKVNQGDILIVHTLAVWMNPILSKISGIVTETGGVLQHAAIMAREFKKPCIVGTKIALRVLNNNDIVTLDAKNGLLLIK